MIGNTESIAVAPATETDSNEPIFLAITGIKNMANSSLNILDKKAIPPNSTLTFESSIAEKEYQPIPALIATDSPTERDSNIEATAPPANDEIIVINGRNKTFLFNFFKSFKMLSFFPISIPIKNNNRYKPNCISREISKLIYDFVKYPKSIPTITAQETIIIFYPSNRIVLQK